MPSPRRKPKAFSGHSQTARPLVFTTKWNNLVEFTDQHGKPFRRFYQLDTLTSAVDKLVRERDRLFQPAIEKVLGPGKANSMLFSLTAEDEWRLIFTIKVTAVNNRKTTLSLVVAKNPEEGSSRVAQEYKHLRLLHERLKDEMTEPLRAGILFLPDRYRREEHHRELQAYLTALPVGYEPLGIHRNLQYTAGTSPPHTFSKKETEVLKQKMATLALNAYHPVTRNGLDTGQLDPSTFQVNRSGKSMPKLKLFNCVHMQTRLTSTRVIAFLLTDTWTCRGNESSVAPESPSMFFEAIVNAVGPETAKQWLKQYCHQAKAGKVKSPSPDYLEGLSEFAN